MGKEINLLKNYPKTKRNTSERQIEKKYGSSINS